MPNIIVRQNAKYGCSAVVQNIVVRQNAAPPTLDCKVTKKNNFIQSSFLGI